MKKRDDMFNRYIKKVHDIIDMLNQEGYSTAECRYCEIMATILLLILDVLGTIRLALFFLVGAFIASLF